MAGISGLFLVVGGERIGSSQCQVLVGAGQESDGPFTCGGNSRTSLRCHSNASTPAKTVGTVVVTGTETRQAIIH
eukprot:2018204-Amphidinium_carterae.1